MDGATARHDPMASMCDLDAEQSVLAGALMAGIDGVSLWTEMSTVVSAEDFHNPAHAIIWQAQGELIRKDIAIDVGTLANELRAMGRINAVGGAQYLGELTDRFASYVWAIEHARIVAAHARRRRIYNAAHLTMLKAVDCFDADEVSSYASAELQKAVTAREQKSGAYLRDVLDEAVKAVEDAMGGVANAVNTGITALDAKLGSWRPKQIITVAARTAGGKTTFVLQVALNVARKGRTVVFFSLEMSRDELLLKLACAEVGVEWAEFENGLVNAEKINAVFCAAETISALPIYVDDSGELDANKCRTIVMREKLTSDVALVVVDYLQLLEPLNPKANTADQIALTCKTLKLAAMRTDVPWALLSQFNQEGAKAEGDPKLGHLLGSGAISHCSSKVIFLQRKEDNPEDGKAPTEVLIKKNRNGATGKVELMFDLKHGRFVSPDGGPAPTGDDLPSERFSPGNEGFDDEQI